MAALTTTRNQTSSEEANTHEDLPVLYDIDFDATDSTERPPWEEDTRLRSLDIDLEHDSYVMGFTGPRGSGKTLSMTYFAVKAAILYGMRILSNYEIAFRLVTRRGVPSRIIMSEPLDLYRLLQFDADYKHCVILLDEAPVIISYMSSVTWKNRILDIFMQQLRKLGNSFLFCAQNEMWVDKQLRWQTDILVKCKDLSRKYSGLKRGETIGLDMTDESGLWTGMAYDERPKIYGFTLEDCTRFFPIYDTHKTIDVLEALKKVQVDTGAYKLGGDAEEPTLDLGRVENQVRQLFDSMPRMRQSELWATLGISKPQQKAEVRKILRDLGVVEKNTNSGLYLQLDGFSAYVPRKE